MKKPKILFILKIPPPITGVTLMNQRILNSELIKNNFSAKYVGMNFENSMNNLGSMGLSKFILFMKFFFQTIKILITWQPKLVYFQLSRQGAAFFRDILLVFVLKIFRKKTVFHLRGKIRQLTTNSNIYKFFYRYSFKNNYIIVNSQLLIDDVTNVYNKTVYYVLNGIEEKITNDMLMQKKDNPVPVLLFISHLLINKGILVFIKALQILASKNIQFQALIVGDETKELSFQKLNEIITDFQLKNYVKICGPKINEEKNHMFLQSDIFIFPTLDETFGNVVLEAMQAALPVIASNEGSLPLIVQDNYNGFLFEKGNIHQLAEKIIFLINNPDIRKTYGLCGRKIFEENYKLIHFETRITNTLQILLN